MYGLVHGEGDFEDVTTYRDLYNAQWRYIADRRGTDTMMPPAQLEGSAFPIPRATNADVLGIVTYWADALASSTDAHWQRVAAEALLASKAGFPSAVYANNNELWRVLQKVAHPQRAITQLKMAA